MNTAVTHRQTAQPHMTVMVPAYNEEKNIAKTLQNIRHDLQQMSPSWDIVVVDDGSRDQTSQVVQSLVDECHVTLVKFSRNFGKENAISAGLSYAKGEIVICMDADGQHASDLMYTMLVVSVPGSQVARGRPTGVCGRRRFRGAQPFGTQISRPQYTYVHVYVAHGDRIPASVCHG